MRPEEQLRALSRGCAEIINEEELLAKLRKDRPLRVKLGVDPTAASVTLGWAVVLRKLRDFQRLGHTAVLIIGDFTAMIGDPSGKSKTRPQLTRDEVRRNVEGVSQQIYKILDPERTEVRYNADWLGKMHFSDVIRLAARTTVARILERDDFKNRMDEARPIGLHEILYPLCQGYDSVAVESDVELGGTDQKFNNLVGRDLQRDYDQEPQVVILMPLLVGTDGTEKMSQSLNNYVGITEPPNEMFGKTMSIPDELIANWFTLCTDVPEEEIAEIEKAMNGGTLNPRDAKRRLAREIVALYHGEQAAQEADEFFLRTFSKRELPDEAPEVSIPESCVKDGMVQIPALIHAIGLAKSVSEARRLMQSGGVYLDGERLNDPTARVPLVDAVGKVLRVGKHRFRKLCSGEGDRSCETLPPP